MSDSFIHAFAGAMGGFMSGIATCPLDVIKTKLQAQGAFRRALAEGGKPTTDVIYKGFTGSVRTIWKDERLRGFYRGLGPIVMGYLPTWGVYFFVYEDLKQRTITNVTLDKNLILTQMQAAVIAGASSTMITNPIWVIKTRLMSQAKHFQGSDSNGQFQYKSTFHAAKTMYQQEGWRAFYSGMGPALLGLTHVAIQFPLYELMKRQVAARSESGKTGTWGYLGCTIASKVIASCATYPHEVIRTRLQTQQRANGTSTTRIGSGPVAVNGVQPRYKGIVGTAKTILKEEGWRAFYSGMGTNMLRAVPASCVTLVTYETLSGAMKNWKDRKIEAEMALHASS
ncbi:mitochondrial carrier [Ascobolus immersus RN42]|uniref:Mitochondrial carrier n=1 Tax=Ascobolus immersus RN42 TaxID=1160509 RepID=A0A3N4I6W1_ASCIM|nr:mitochondrial carrier [Ascobolus immersus RN42]